LIKLLQADNFFKQEDVNMLFHTINNLQFVEKIHGEEIENFNMVIPDLDPIFSKLLAEEVTVDEDNSGIFRKPNIDIHFESFTSLSDWVFIIALQQTTFNLYHHSSGAKTALDEHRLNYKDYIEWDYHTNILLQPNEGIIFRPWLFHSLEPGLVQVYKLKGKVNV
jgi:hypothetical protein